MTYVDNLLRLQNGKWILTQELHEEQRGLVKLCFVGWAILRSTKVSKVSTFMKI